MKTTCSKVIQTYFGVLTIIIDHTYIQNKDSKDSPAKYSSQFEHHPLLVPAIVPSHTSSR